MSDQKKGRPGVNVGSLDEKSCEALLAATGADTLGRIAMTGESKRFVGEAHQLGRWYDVYAFRIDAPEDRHVAAVFHDVTERVREKEELKQADRRKNEFMAVLAHELRNPLVGAGYRRT